MPSRGRALLMSGIERTPHMGLIVFPPSGPGARRFTETWNVLSGFNRSIFKALKNERDRHSWLRTMRMGSLQL